MLNGNLSRRDFLKLTLAGSLALAASPAGILAAQPEGRLALYNIHTGERCRITYRNSENMYDPQALEALNHIFRCHYTGKTMPIDINVIEYLNAVDKSLNSGNEIHIISGYRSPEYNRLLMKQGRGVAKGSFHLAGRAIDFCIPGKKLSKLKETALKLRYGGVGYYPTAGFVHIDSGRFRTW